MSTLLRALAHSSDRIAKKAGLFGVRLFCFLEISVLSVGYGLAPSIGALFFAAYLFSLSPLSSNLSLLCCQWRSARCLNDRLNSLLILFRIRRKCRLRRRHLQLNARRLGHQIFRRRRSLWLLRCRSCFRFGPRRNGIRQWKHFGGLNVRSWSGTLLAPATAQACRDQQPQNGRPPAYRESCPCAHKG